MHDPVEIKVRAATLTIDTVEQFFVEVPRPREARRARRRCSRPSAPSRRSSSPGRRSASTGSPAASATTGVRVKALHGDMTQGQRDGVMIAFKGGRERLLVATDVAARGLDITGVSHVVNYDIPNSPDIYVHRIGRTGRAGETGRAITLITPKQRADLEAIERHAKTEIEQWAEAGPTASRERADAARAARAPARRAAPRHTKPHSRDGDARTRSWSSAPAAQHGIEPADVVRRGRRQLASRERRRAQRARARALQLRRGARRAGRGGGRQGQRKASPGH